MRKHLERLGWGVAIAAAAAVFAFGASEAYAAAGGVNRADCTDPYICFYPNGAELCDLCCLDQSGLHGQCVQPYNACLCYSR